MNFIFWNIGKNRIGDVLRELVTSYNTDILILAESPYKPDELLFILNRDSPDFFFSPGRTCLKIQIYTRFKGDLLKPIEERPRTTGRNLFSAKYGDVTVIATHYQSKVSWSDADQAAHALSFRELIESIENQLGHKRTIICGDFNMNPFDHGMIQSSGIHSVMERKTAQRMSRKIESKEYPFFYNPMWGFLGDLGRGKVSGTMYFSPAKPVNFHWHIFDQVILRPELIDDFEDDELDIITEFGGINLLNDNGLVEDQYSDHLPIKFRFNL